MITQALLVALVLYIAKFMGQPLVERPLICGAMVGVVLGDFQQDIIIGVSLELIFLGTITIGGSVPADLAVGSVLASAFTILTKAEPAVEVALAFLISLLAVFVYQVENLIYTGLVEKYNALLNAGRDKAALGMTFGMMLFYGVPFAIIAFLAFFIGRTLFVSWWKVFRPL